MATGFNLFDFQNLGGNQLNKAVSQQKLPTVAPYNPWVQPTYSKPVQKTTVWGEIKFNWPSTPWVYDKLYNMGTGLADWTAWVVTERAKEERQGGMTENQMRAVVKEMRKDKLSDEDIALQLEAIDNQLKSEYKQQEQKNYEQASPIRKLAWGAVNIAAGNLQTLSQYGGNILDVATFWQTGIWEDVSKMMEQNKDLYGNSTAFKAGTFLPDVALWVSPIGWGYLAWAKWAWSLALRSGAVWAWFWATQPILEQWSNVDIGDIVTWGAVWWTLGATLPLAGAWVVKLIKWAWKYISKTLPENLQVSSQFNRADLTNVSERLAKLTGKDVEVEDAARWLLDRWVKWDLKTQRQQIQAIIAKEEENASKILSSKLWDIWETKEANNLRKALSEKLDNYLDKDWIPTAGNEDIVSKIQSIISNKSMTLQEMNNWRKILADWLFTKQWTMKELASKEWWQNVWKDTSKFIESKAPWFRATNKNIEVGIAIDKAMLKKETAEQTRAMLAYLWFGWSIWSAGWYAMWWDLESAVKWAAIWFWVWQISRILNSPKVKSTLAYYLNKLSPEARSTIKNLQKWVEVKVENIWKVVEEIKMLPPPSGKPTSAKVINVKPIELPSKLQQNEITGKSIIKRPKGEVKTQWQATLWKEIIRTKQLSKITEELKRSTQSARYGGTWETKIVDSIKARLNNGEISRSEAQNILFDILDRIDEKWFDYMEWWKTISKFIDELSTYKPTTKPKTSLKINETQSKVNTPEIPEGYIKNPLTGEIIKKPKGMNAGFLKIGVPEKPSIKAPEKKIEIKPVKKLNTWEDITLVRWTGGKWSGAGEAIRGKWLYLTDNIDVAKHYWPEIKSVTLKNSDILDWWETLKNSKQIISTLPKEMRVYLDDNFEYSYNSLIKTIEWNTGIEAEVISEALNNTIKWKYKWVKFEIWLVNDSLSDRWLGNKNAFVIFSNEKPIKVPEKKINK